MSRSEIKVACHVMAFPGGGPQAGTSVDAHNCLRSSPAGRMTSLDSMEPGPDGGRPAPQLLDPADEPVAALPVTLREGLALHELEGLSYKEIAYVTGMAIGTAMSRLRRARWALTLGRAQGATP
jgi:DNA-directed RNA polymerase specialized sigma24 family protein